MVEVAAGIVSDPEGRVLVAQRPDGKHLAGMWEFPGGKVEPGEDAAAALARELHEEIGIDVHASEPLLALTHRYPEKTIRLLIRAVTDWRGRPHGREGQALRWAGRGELAALEMPAGNRPIARMLELPPCLAISPDPEGFPDTEAFLADWTRRAARGYLLQLRAHSLSSSADRGLLELARACAEIARAHRVPWLLNGPPELAQTAGAHGVHLPGWRLNQLPQRPLGQDAIVSAACHSLDDIRRAAALGLDFVTLSPVRRTASHPDRPAIGFDRLERICRDSPLPVYALGGVGPEDLDRARACGAFGVAGIRAFGDSRSNPLPAAL